MKYEISPDFNNQFYISVINNDRKIRNQCQSYFLATPANTS